MGEETLLLNPGPVNLADRIREALGEPMVSHRSQAFESIYADVNDGLRHVYTNSRHDGTTSPWDGEAIVFNATATMGMEASIANFTDSDSTVLSLVNGNFGRRFEQIADRQCTVETYEIPWGESFDTDAVAAAVHDGDYDLVTAVHTETSTGLRNPIGAIGAAVDETDALFVVDGVSSIGGERIHPAEWHVDIAVVDAQKAFAASPGISAMFLSQRAIEALPDDQQYFYADVGWHLDKLSDQQTPFTSAVSLFRALNASLDHIVETGVDAWLTAHEQRSRAWEEAAQALGLELFASPSGESNFANTVTAIELPDPVTDDPEPFFEALRDRNVFVGGGHAHLSGQIFRLGTMGELGLDEMDRGIVAIGEALTAGGATVDVEAAREALQTHLE